MSHRTHTLNSSASSVEPTPEPTHANMEWVWRPGYGWVSRIIAPELLARLGDDS